MKRTTAVIHLSTIAMLAAVIGIANSVAFNYGGVIDLYLSKNEVDLDSTKVENALSQGKDLAVEVTQNGAVLLKNENNCLPLTAPKINIFGWGGSDNGFLYQGGGSSEGGFSGDMVTFYQSFRNAGFQLNENLCSAYNSLSYRREGAPDQDQWSTYYRLYEPGESFYTTSLMSEAKNFSDTALMVFSRRATEGDDLPKCQYDENGQQDNSRSYLSLSDKEALMISQVTANFSKVICLFDGSAPMEMGFLDYSGIDAALHVGYPGYYGCTAIADILNGGTNPSGKMVDTAAYDITTAPSYVNTGNQATHTYSGRSGGKYTDYAEDIYVGYRWYETADKEGYWDGKSMNSYGKELSGYDAIVQYPFGYGLSYTNFDWKVLSAKVGDTDISAGSALKADDTITYTVWVENTGTVAGKDVVELYYEAPYTSGGIEKSSIDLIDFQKTAILQPGKGEQLTLKCRVADMASYDTYDKNNNGFMGYEVEGGNYNLSLRTDVHHVKKIDNTNASYSYSVPSEGFKYAKDPDTGAAVSNHFTTYTNTVSGASSTIDEPQATYAISIEGNDSNSDYNQGIKYLTRSNFKGTFPVETEVRSSTSNFLNNVFKVHSPIINDSDTMPKTGVDSGLTLDDVKGLSYDDPKWQTLIEQLTPEEMANLSAGGGFGTIAISKIKKPKCTDSDGGTGFTSSVATGNGGHAVKYAAANVLSQTWDWKEAYKWGHAIGTEGQALSIQGWYAPGCNVHRSPLGGRNFEYFSEDGRMCGTFVGWAVKGATENGVYCYTKHFAGNDSDAGRNGQFKWMTEQSLREIYAKPLEIATKIGQANAAMISVDRIGSVRATGSYALLTSLLRNEWGFRGSTITDYYQGGNVNDVDEGIRAGCDLALSPNATYKIFNDYQSATSVKALQNAAHNILFTYIDTVYRTATNTGVDLGSTTGSMTTSNDGTWWRPTLISIDAVIGVGLASWGVVCVLNTWVLKKKSIPAKKED